MFKLSTAALAATLFSLSPALHAGQTTFGAPNCGDWVKSDNVARRAWVLGYLSGVNFLVNNDPLDQIQSAEQIFLWTTNYCKNHPLDSVVKAANELMIELQQREKKK